MEGRKQQVRAVIDDFLTPEECKELIHIHRSNSVVGYRHRFTVTTLRELVANNNQLYLPTLVKIRDALHHATEERGECLMQLFVEWTGLSCWHSGSSIPPHYDNNRDYLKQRDYSAIIYLNNQGDDFEGGTFFFTDPTGKGHVQAVTAKAGRALIFSSGPENTHCVTEVLRGERYTFTLWLTFDASFNEDPSILRFLPHFTTTTTQPTIITSGGSAEFNSREKKSEETKEERVVSEGGDVYSTEEQNEVKESEKAELWDLEKEKMDYYGLEVYLGGLSDTPAIYRKGVPFTSQVLINCQGVLLPYVFHNTQEAIELASFHEWKNMRIPKEECQAHPSKKRKREEKPSDGDRVCKLSSLLNEEDGAAFYDLLRDWHQFRFAGQKSFLSSVVKWQEMGILFYSCSAFLFSLCLKFVLAGAVVYNPEPSLYFIVFACFVHSVFELQEWFPRPKTRHPPN